jgi:hypothetical protein
MLRKESFYSIPLSTLRDVGLEYSDQAPRGNDASSILLMFVIDIDFYYLAAVVSLVVFADTML